MYSNYPWNRYFPSNNTRNDTNIMKVTGEATINVQPDQATITLGVISENENLETAQSEDAERMNRVIQALLNAGIQREKIQTIDYRIDLNYDYKDGQQIFRGYRVSNIIHVTVGEINRIGQIVDLAVDHGVNTLRNIDMTIKEKENYYNQALTRAIHNATQKAKVIGSTIGVNVNQVPFKVIEITEQQKERPREVVLGLSTDSASVPTPIEPGLIEIKAVVELVLGY